MFIENRIKYNETKQIVVKISNSIKNKISRKTCYLFLFKYRFFRTKEVGKVSKLTYNFVSISRDTKADKSVNYKTKKGLLIYNPKQLFAKLKQKSLKFPRIKNSRRTKRLFKRKRA